MAIVALLQRSLPAAAAPAVGEWGPLPGPLPGAVLGGNVVHIAVLFNVGAARTCGAQKE